MQALLSGVLANWLVGMAAFFATMGRTIFGKYIPVLLAVTTFVAAGFQHAPGQPRILRPVDLRRGGGCGVVGGELESHTRRDRQHDRRNRPGRASLLVPVRSSAVTRDRRQRPNSRPAQEAPRSPSKHRVESSEQQLT